jgi:hypothetical protein
MTDKRGAQRQRVLKGATIEFDGSAFSCVVRNISPVGAALEVGSSIGIPQQFDLVFAADRSRQLCRVVWRKERRIGVKFNGR